MQRILQRDLANALIQRSRVQDDGPGRAGADDLYVVAVQRLEQRKYVEHALAEERAVQMQREECFFVVCAEIDRVCSGRGFAEAGQAEDADLLVIYLILLVG